MITMCWSPLFRVVLQSASEGGIFSEKADFRRHLRFKGKSCEVNGGIVSELLHQTTQAVI